jgi:hypothetical protein
VIAARGIMPPTVGVWVNGSLLDGDSFITHEGCCYKLYGQGGESVPQATREEELAFEQHFFELFFTAEVPQSAPEPTDKKAAKTARAAFRDWERLKALGHSPIGIYACGKIVKGRDRTKLPIGPAGSGVAKPQ